MPRLSLNRRDMLERCAASGLLLAGTGFLGSIAELYARAETGAGRRPTARNEMGPFYRRGAPSRAQLRAEGDPGLPLLVEGTVFDARGERRPDATVEVWQANHHGKYDLQGYRYRALLETDDRGGYRFDSVMPGHYPDRVAQHVHYLVQAPGCRPLITQLYFATDPAFEGDPDRRYSKDPLVLHRELVRPVLLTGDPDQPMARVTFELCLERL